jgi:hypothetical protein
MYSASLGRVFKCRYFRYNVYLSGIDYRALEKTTVRLDNFTKRCPYVVEIHFCFCARLKGKVEL